MSIADEIIVKLTAQTDQLKAGMAEGAASVQASMDSIRASGAAASASILQTGKDFQTLDAIMAGSVKSANEVAEAEYALDRLMSAGAISAAEQGAALEALNASAGTVKLAVNEAAAATNGFASALTRNSRTSYSASALITDALTGQFGRSRREIAALANETGLMGRALGALLSPVGIAVAAVAALAAVGLEGADNWATLRGIIVETNGALGLTAQDLQDIASSAAFGNQTMGDARDAVEKLGATGQFTGEQLKMATNAAVDLGNITGESADKAAAALLRMAKDPQKELVALNDQYGFLSVAQAEDIANLIKQGDQYDALNLILKDTQDGLDKLAEKVNEQRSPLGQLFDFWHRGFSNMMNDLEDLLDGNDLVKFWNDAAAAYNNYSNQVASESHGLINLGHANLYNPEQGEGEQSAREKQDQKRQVSGILDPKSKGDADSENASADNQIEQQREQLGATKQELIADWKQIADAADVGSEEWMNALNHINELQKQLGVEQREQAKRAAEEARRESEKEKTAKLNTLEIERGKTDEFTAARIASDQKIVDFAKAAYGEASSQYKTALAQMEADTKAQAQQARELDAQTAADKLKLVETQLETQKQIAQNQFDAGKISAAEMVQIEIGLVAKKLAAEQNYYRTLSALDKDNVKAIRRDQDEITQAIADAAKERAQIEDRGLKASEQHWKQYSQRIQGSVTTAVNGMIFQHESFRNAVASIGESIVEEFIANEVKQLFTTQAVEASKTTAVIAGNEMRVAADTSGQAQSLAVQGESAIKWIITEAAKAAAGAFNAMVSIPYVGPFLAVGASIAAFAAVSKLVSSVASAEGGWERVPADGMTTVLHKDEMVLPKHVADPVRNMAKSGGGGGDHFHIHAADARSFMDMARRRPADMAKMARQLKSRGYRV